MEKQKMVYVYRSAKGFQQYGHPEISIYYLAKDHNGYYLGSEVLCIKGQIDKDTPFPYGLRATFRFDFSDKVPALIKKLNPHGFANYRNLLKGLKKLKIERWINIAGISQDLYLKNISTPWVPRKYKNHAELFINATKAGLTISRKGVHA